MGWASSWLHKTLDVKKLSRAKACANVISLLLVSSVKAVRDSPSLAAIPPPALLLPDPEVSHTS